MVGEQEALIARVLNLFAQRFPRQAVLRGGMVLRVLGSPRLTNDLDYLFIPSDELPGLAMQFRSAFARLR